MFIIAASLCAVAYRLQTALNLLEVTHELEAAMRGTSYLDKISLCVLHGASDKVCPPADSIYLVSRATSSDKMVKTYPGMLHNLLCGELKPNSDRVWRDVESWLDKRSV